MEFMTDSETRPCGSNILVVEDDPYVAQDIVLSLESFGYCVPTTCDNGDQAIRWASQLRPDLVLMDIVLDGKMDGIQAAQHIASHLQIPIIYLTAYADDEFLQRARITEPYSYLLKPYTRHTLHVAVAMALYKAVSERKLKQAAWLADTLMSLSQGVIVTDTAAGIIYLNAAVARLFGPDIDIPRDLSADKILVVDARANTVPLRKIVNQVIASNDSVRLDNSALQVAGHAVTIHADITAGPIRDERGHLRGATVTVCDISGRMRTEHALTESELRYRTLLDTMNEGVAVLDRSGEIVYHNRKLTELLACDDLQSGLLEDFLQASPEARTAQSQRFSGGMHSFELPVRPIDPAAPPLRLSSAPLPGADGQHTGAIVVLSDMTSRVSEERRRMDEARDQRDNLIREVHHRIKNNLQGVIGLLRVQLKKQAGIGTVLDEAITQIQSMAIVHGLQCTGPRQGVLLCKAVQAICTATGALLQVPISPTVECESSRSVMLSKEEAAPIALILNELIFNAIKHSAAGTTPDVAITVVSPDIMVAIANAPGQPVTAFDFQTGGGLGTGLDLVRSLLPTEGAALHFDNRPDRLTATLALSQPVLLSDQDGTEYFQDQQKSSLL
jgi:PAS domain S-box-containing protein